ncbi:hypothetical protein M8J77_015365 [Diaphorina citri]|nr:hypothetical protein M8J77_015365 [Diaphorina citri]
MKKLFIVLVSTIALLFPVHTAPHKTHIDGKVRLTITDYFSESLEEPSSVSNMYFLVPENDEYVAAEESEEFTNFEEILLMIYLESMPVSTIALLFPVHTAPHKTHIDGKVRLTITDYFSESLEEPSSVSNMYFLVPENDEYVAAEESEEFTNFEEILLMIYLESMPDSESQHTRNEYFAEEEYSSEFLQEPSPVPFEPIQEQEPSPPEPSHAEESEELTISEEILLVKYLENMTDSESQEFDELVDGYLKLQTGNDSDVDEFLKEFLQDTEESSKELHEVPSLPLELVNNKGNTEGDEVEKKKTKTKTDVASLNVNNTKPNASSKNRTSRLKDENSRNLLTTPFTDTPKTTPFTDDPKTTPFTDAPKTTPFTDSRRPEPFADDPKTTPFTDIPDTTPFTDPPKTTLFMDDPKTTPFTDIAKTTPFTDINGTTPFTDAIVFKEVSYISVSRYYK